MTASRFVILAIAAGALLAACTSDSSNDLNLDTTAPTTEVAETTTTDVVTATTKVAEQTTTTVEATTTPIATEPPTTAVESTPTSTSSVEAQVEDDFEAAQAARLRCGQDPENCDFAASALPGSPADENTRAAIKSQLDNNLRAVAGKGDYKSRIDGIEVHGDVAYVTVCSFDTAILFDIGDLSNPDDDIIVNDLEVSNIVEWEMRFLENRWGAYASQRLQRLEGGDLCGF